MFCTVGYCPQGNPAGSAVRPLFLMVSVAEPFVPCPACSHSTGNGRTHHGQCIIQVSEHLNSCEFRAWHVEEGGRRGIFYCSQHQVLRGSDLK